MIWRVITNRKTVRLALEDGDRELNKTSATAFRKRDVELQERDLWGTYDEW